MTTFIAVHLLRAACTLRSIVLYKVRPMVRNWWRWPTFNYDLREMSFTFRPTLLVWAQAYTGEKRKNPLASEGHSAVVEKWDGTNFPGFAHSNGKYVRLLYDSGTAHSYISQDTARALGCRPILSADGQHQLCELTLHTFAYAYVQQNKRNKEEEDETTGQKIPTQQQQQLSSYPFFANVRLRIHPTCKKFVTNTPPPAQVLADVVGEHYRIGLWDWDNLAPIDIFMGDDLWPQLCLPTTHAQHCLSLCPDGPSNGTLHLIETNLGYTLQGHNKAQGELQTRDTSHLQPRNGATWRELLRMPTIQVEYAISGCILLFYSCCYYFFYCQ